MRKLSFHSVVVVSILSIAPVGAAESETIAIIGTGNLGESPSACNDYDAGSIWDWGDRLDQIPPND